MKNTTLFLITLMTMNTNALESNCFNKVINEYQSSSSMAAYSRVYEEYDIISINEIATYGRHAKFGPFEETKLAFHAKGSFHSGWFHKVIIVSPETCKIEEIQLVADEY